MNKIWKFEIKVNDVITINMPKQTKILSLQVQAGIPVIWALVNPENENEIRNFELFGTGFDIPYDIEMGSNDRKYIGTFQLVKDEKWFAFHLFEHFN